jgi:hypothetical protein
MQLDLGAITAIHTALSLITLAIGTLAVTALFTNSISQRWTTWFLALAVATTVTGFFFPFQAVTPAFATGIVSSFILIGMLAARYVGHYAGAWRWIYAGGVVVSLYLMVFVTIAQVFTKTPALNPPGLSFAATQLVALVIFIFLGIHAAKKFQPR